MRASLTRDYTKRSRARLVGTALPSNPPALEFGNWGASMKIYLCCAAFVAIAAGVYVGYTFGVGLGIIAWALLFALSLALTKQTRKAAGTFLSAVMSLPF